MTKRVVEVSQHPARVSVSRRQLVIESVVNGEKTANQLPAEDLAMLLLDQRQCTITQPALALVAESGGITVLSGSNHLPVAVVLPVSRHVETVVRINDQIAASVPLKKRLWQQLVVTKIRAQAANLRDSADQQAKLQKIARQVRSGDSTNCEAHAARVYWPAWAKSHDFRRDPDMEGVNALLNYGYAVIRAALARALVGSGFCTAIGLHHHNRSNPFCLADDMMEPYRPLVDRHVRLLTNEGVTEINTQTRQHLCGILFAPVVLDNQRLPMLDSMHHLSASLAACLTRQKQSLAIPVMEEA